MNFSTLQGLTIPEGVVTQIMKDGVILWSAGGGKVILQVEKITSNTYAGETTYSNEQFILLDIYPKTNGTVKVTYGGLTKTIKDTSGAAEPNAQQVFFGTFNGVSDSVTTPTIGELTIEGDYYAFGRGMYGYSSKYNYACGCITKILEWGSVETIPDMAFNIALKVGTASGLKGELVIPNAIKYIGKDAFGDNLQLTSVVIESTNLVIGESAFNTLNVDEANSRKLTVRMMANTPPTLMSTTSTSDGSVYYTNFGIVTATYLWLKEIIVPKGCGTTYKAAPGWSAYASYIVEAS